MCPKDNKTDCIFCKIIAGEIPSNIVYKDKDVIAFPDINPSAPVHIMVVPVKHIATMNQITDADAPLLGKLMAAAAKIAKDRGLDKTGYRLVINTGADAGQVVQHIHVHLLGGRVFKWDQ
jgi:histidine triad (HIT) family protein